MVPVRRAGTKPAGGGRGVDGRSAYTLARAHALPSVSVVASADVGDVPASAILEIGWDGQLVLAARVGDDVRLFGAAMRDWTEPFARLAFALRRLREDDVVLVGHVCALDARGLPSFELLRAWVSGEHGARLVFAVSDVLSIGAEDLRALPPAARRARLPALLDGLPESIVLSAALPGPLPRVLASMAGLGLGGALVRTDDAWRLVSASPVEAAPRSQRTLSPKPRVTNADKILFPRDGITKAELAAYYADVAPLLLAHAEDRPIVAQRWPDGIDDFTWYQHRVPPRAPDYLRPVMIDGDRRIVLRSPDALGFMVNQAAITFHGWASRVGSLDHADWAILDLDRGEKTTWAELIDVALALRALLELLSLPSLVKTSGQKGLHVLVPLAPGQSFDEAQTFARAAAQAISALMPTVVTLEMEKEKRGGKLLLDHVNHRGKSLVLPYSLRAKDGAPVSTPIAWSEVTYALSPASFTMRTMRARLDARGDLFRTDARAILRPAIARLGKSLELTAHSLPLSAHSQQLVRSSLPSAAARRRGPKAES